MLWCSSRRAGRICSVTWWCCWYVCAVWCDIQRVGYWGAGNCTICCVAVVCSVCGEIHSPRDLVVWSDVCCVVCSAECLVCVSLLLFCCWSLVEHVSWPIHPTTVCHCVCVVLECILGCPFLSRFTMPHVISAQFIAMIAGMSSQCPVPVVWYLSHAQMARQLSRPSHCTATAAFRTVMPCTYVPSSPRTATQPTNTEPRRHTDTHDRQMEQRHLQHTNVTRLPTVPGKFHSRCSTSHHQQHTATPHSPACQPLHSLFNQTHQQRNTTSK